MIAINVSRQKAGSNKILINSARTNSWKSKGRTAISWKSERKTSLFNSTLLFIFRCACHHEENRKNFSENLYSLIFRANLHLDHFEVYLRHENTCYSSRCIYIWIKFNFLTYNNRRIIDAFLLGWQLSAVRPKGPGSFYRVVVIWRVELSSLELTVEWWGVELS